MAANYDFVYNSDELQDLIDQINRDTEDMWDNCNAMLDEVTNMGNDWKGDSYTEFANGVKKYEPAIRAIPAVLVAFGNAVNDAKTNGDDLIKKVIDDLEIE